MRPIASPDDSFAAGELLAQALADDLVGFRVLVPPDSTPNAVEIAEDGSAAAFDVYPGTERDAHLTGHPIARIFIRR
jgi:hypothetical protein